MSTIELQRQYQREWLARRRKAWLDEHGPCSVCRSTEGLEVHHLDPTQKISHNVWSWSAKRREAELAKCLVLCHDCHRAVTTAAMIKTHCHKGHSFDITGRDNDGHCSKCRRERQTAIRQKRKMP